MPSSAFLLPLEVRDYECDQQGIVNNAVYQNYLEHARHCFLRSHGIDFSEVTRQGLFLIVIHADIHYLKPLRAGEQCQISVQLEQLSPVRFRFIQEIRRPADGAITLKASITTAAMNRDGQPVRIPKELLANLPLS
ncbi:MAG: hypothetical protein RL648_69 [Verrucomicrobiota bacterium]|jgi:acyl-CoA thioester hydrolase